ncbi:MAG: GNAT family N-acetyltransferase [Hyphomonadaceae bacterium]|nr:GNAT family N-acetyltransferase [Hyphomonadaceae bacterium]
MAPTLETERLVLRPYRIEDFEAFAAYFASPRSKYTDGPVSRSAAWDLFTAGAGRWVLASHGAWTIERQSDAKAVGLVSLNSAISIPHPELGWILWEGYEGHGYAVEAARNARDFAFDFLQWPVLISGIHEDNAASIKLAARLNAEYDPDITLKEEPETQFFRHKKA